MVMAKKWMSIPLPIHRVAISGRVELGFQDNETWTLLPQQAKQIRVELIEAPDSFKRKMQLKALSHGDAWETLARRPDRTQTAEDGSFYFLDLPAGEYQLQATVPKGLTNWTLIPPTEPVTVLESASLPPPFITLKLAKPLKASDTV